jgi:molecular chaperone HscB
VPRRLNHLFLALAAESTAPEVMVNATTIDTGICPFCAAAAGEHLCTECGRVQPVARGTDYFAFLGLPRKLRLNERELEKRFYALSRQLHPDYFMNASPKEQQASLEQSSELNDAYRTLREPIPRIQYLLSLEGYKEAEKKAPPDLLEEVFELNMQIEELKAAKEAADGDSVAEAAQALQEALSHLRERMAKIDRRLEELFAKWDNAIDGGVLEEKTSLLDRMSELLSHRSYISHLVSDIEEEL